MNYAGLKTHSIENGNGIRVSLFVSGCSHHCKGCFNQETWDFNYGRPFTKEDEDEIINTVKPAYISGLTVLGGEPGEPENQEGLLPLLRRMRRELPGKTVWVYTGYFYEDFLPGGRAYCNTANEFLSLCDIMVDGPFILEEKDISLKFRGSKNQRIIDLRKTRETGEMILAME